MRRGKIVYKAGFGRYGLELPSPPDENTIYHIASLTKAFSATAVMMIADQGKVDVHAPLASVIPEFQLQDQWIGEHVTPIDILSHRVGIAGGNWLWSQGGNRNHLRMDELVRTLTTAPQVQDFRQGFLYHNLPYGLFAELVERTTGQTYGSFITENIFQALGMHRSSIKMDGPSPENYAKAYMPMDDGSFVSIDRPETKDGTIQASAGGVRSCVKDLLSFYNEILKARRREEASASEGSSGVIRNASLLTAGHTFLSHSSLYERFAAVGLLRVQLPNTFDDIGPNSGLITPMPTIGRDDPSRLVLFHQGSYPDWIGQFLLEQALDTTHKTDFVALAQQSRDAYVQSFVDAGIQLEGGKDPQQDVKSVNAYTGDYFNALQNFYIRVFDQDDALYMCFHGQAWDFYPLQPYAADTFTWYTSRENQAKWGRWPIQAGDYFHV